jgi:hypothetical protein
MIKFPAIALIAFLLIASLAWAFTSNRRGRLRQQREAGYQVALSSYQRDLQPGQTRAQVDTYLHSRNVSADQAQYESPTWDEFIRLGKEHSSRFCAHDDIDVRLAFAPSGSTPQAPATPNDTLTQVSLFTWSRDCL